MRKNFFTPALIIGIMLISSLTFADDKIEKKYNLDDFTSI